MNTYEITFIAKEDSKEPVVKKAVEVLAGRVLSEVKLGQKNFVYPIKKEKSGFYTSLVFEIDPEKVQDLNRKLLLEEEILRFLIVSINVNKAMTEVPAIELKPEEITGKQEETTAIIEPEQSLDKARESVIIEAPVAEIIAKEEPAVGEKTVEIKKEPEEVEEIPKKVKKVVEKPVKKEVKPEVETENEEERLKALDKKLEELLKE